jgi:hypothetical protein
MIQDTQILDCGHPPTPTTGGGTGYGEDANGKKRSRRARNRRQICGCGALKSPTLPAAGTARLKVGVEIRRTVAGADFSVPVFVRSQMI